MLKKKINISNINNVIGKIVKLPKTTKKTTKKREELINLLLDVINTGEKIQKNIREYVNYIPDHIFKTIEIETIIII